MVSQNAHIIRRIAIEMLLFQSWDPEKKFQKKPLLDKAVLARAHCATYCVWTKALELFHEDSSLCVHSSIAWYGVNDTASRLVWLCVFIEYLQKPLFLHTAYKQLQNTK